MTTMVVLLLIMNCVLAVGLGLLWVRSRSWCESSMDLEERLQGRMNDLEARMAGVEGGLHENSPNAPERDASNIKERLQSSQASRGVPERYRLAVNMAGSGMDLQEVSDTIGISTYEAQQLMNLARLSREDESGAGASDGRG